MLISEDRYIPEPNTGCFLWLGSTTKGGHGRVYCGEKTKLAHRVAWEEAHGYEPVGLMVCHKCDTPSCVNIDHLYVGDGADNQLDKASRNRGRKSLKGLPYGVQQSKESSTFQVFLAISGKRVSKCGFKTIQEAAEYAIDRKAELIKEKYANRT